MTTRVTQKVLEIIEETASEARATQVVIEVLDLPTAPEARATQVLIEVLQSTQIASSGTKRRSVIVVT